MPAPTTRRKFGHTLLAGAGALVLPAGAALIAGCGRREAAPPMVYTLLDGRAESLAALRGKVALVNFWATSCVTCVQEMPSLATTWRQFQSRGFETLAVAMRYDAPTRVARFAQTRALPFGVVIDNTGTIAQAFGDVSVTPTSFVVDKRGAVARRIVGAPDFARLHELIDALLAEPA